MGTGNWSEKRRWSGPRPCGGTAELVLVCALALSWPQATSGDDPPLPEPPGALTALDSPTVDAESVREPAACAREVPDSPEAQDQACREHPDSCPATPCNAHLVHFLTVGELNATHQPSERSATDLDPMLPSSCATARSWTSTRTCWSLAPCPAGRGRGPTTAASPAPTRWGARGWVTFSTTAWPTTPRNSEVTLVIDSTSQILFYELPMEYLGPDDSPFTLEADWGNDQFVLTNWATSEVHIFHDFYGGDYPGHLKEKTTRAWRAAGEDGVLFTYNEDRSR